LTLSRRYAQRPLWVRLRVRAWRRDPRWAAQELRRRTERWAEVRAAPSHRYSWRPLYLERARWGRTL